MPSFSLLPFLLLFESALICFAATGCTPLIQRTGIKVACLKPDIEDTSNCYKGPVPNGTVANYICDNFYTPLETFEESPERQLICDENLRWKGLPAFYAYSCQLECGTTRGLENEKFVIGGRHISAERWPWHASIFIIKNKEFSYQCGGTLVNAFGRGFILLTAAHCLLDDSNTAIHPNQFRVVLGGQKSDMIENKNDFHAQIFSVQRVVIHEDYAGETHLHRNDIGILKLEGSIAITNTVSPVCLSSNGALSSQQLQKGVYGQVVGFGRATNEGSLSEPSSVLRQAMLPVVDNEGCYQWQKYHLDSSQICAGYLNSLSVCKGDSGGGFIFPKEIAGTLRYYIQGIVSYGYVRNETYCENYGVFTKIQHHTKWIQNYAEELLCSDIEEDVYQQELEDTYVAPDCPVCPPHNVTDCTSFTITAAVEEEATSTTEFLKNSSLKVPIRKLALVSKNITEVKADSLEVQPSTKDYSSVKTSNTFSLNAVIGNLIQAIGFELPSQYQSFGLGGNSDYQNLALTLHNNFRSLHGVPPLRLNDKLSREALIYAHKLIRENTFVNEYTFGGSAVPHPYNKNIFQIVETGVNYPSQVLEVVRHAVNHWYSEISKYNWNNPGITTFSQIVWKSTTDFGIGVAIGYQQGQQRTFRHVVVAAYSPPGNMQGENYFRHNVYPRRNYLT